MSIETEHTIPAPPAAVWRIFTDWPAYPEWNTFITYKKPPSQVGQHFAVLLHQKGGQPMVFTPELLALQPERELRWRGKLWGSSLLFVGEHYFRFEPTEGGKATRLVHGEHFAGCLVPLLGGMLKKTEEEFADFNLKLAKRVADVAAASS